MSGQKRPADPSTFSSSGAPPEKRREREGEDGGPSVSSAAGGSTAVETVIKLGGVSNSVRPTFVLRNWTCTFFSSYNNRSQYTNWCIIIFQEEQDIKALQAKNRKLGESLDQRQVSQSSNCNHTLTYIECCSVFSLIENISNSLDILQVIEDELRERIERLETRQATDDASLLILNRYWNQVNMFRPHVKSVTNAEELQCNAIPFSSVWWKC